VKARDAEKVLALLKHLDGSQIVEADDLTPTRSSASDAEPGSATPTPTRSSTSPHPPGPEPARNAA